MGSLQISTIKTNENEIIGVSKRFDGMKKGEIAQFICEMEIAKKELIELWDNVE